MKTILCLTAILAINLTSNAQSNRGSDGLDRRPGAPPIVSQSLNVFDHTIVTLSGEKYHPEQISRVDPDGIMFTTDSGIVKVDMENLPAAVRTKYKLNAHDASEFRAKVALAKANRSAKEIADDQDKELASKIEASGGEMSITVIQTTSLGTLAMAPDYRNIFVYGLSGLGDGDTWRGRVYPTGRDFVYTTVLGAESRVHSFATSLEMAIRINKNNPQE